MVKLGHSPRYPRSIFGGYDLSYRNNALPFLTGSWFVAPRFLWDQHHKPYHQLEHTQCRERLELGLVHEVGFSTFNSSLHSICLRNLSISYISYIMLSNHRYITIKSPYCGWLQNPAPVDRWFIHVYPIIYRVHHHEITTKSTLNHN